MLLTRSPLGLPQCCHCLDLVRLACVKHAASVRPEPGSNSPSRSHQDPVREPRRNQRVGAPWRGHQLAQERNFVVRSSALTRCSPTRVDEPALACFRRLFRCQGALRAHVHQERWCLGFAPASTRSVIGAVQERRDNLGVGPGNVNSSRRERARDGAVSRPRGGTSVPRRSPTVTARPPDRSPGRR